MRCQGCPNRSSPICATHARKRYARVIFIGEAPGRQEALRGLPFVGRSGQLLRPLVKEICERLGVDPTDVAYTNAVACWPHDGRRNIPPTREMLSACRSRLVSDIFSLVEIDKHGNAILPRLVLLGASACSALGLKFRRFADIVNGPCKVEISHDGKEYVFDAWALYHPAYILRTGAYESYNVSMERALRFAFGDGRGDTHRNIDYVFVTTDEQWRRIRREHMNGAMYTVDIETTGVDLKDEITLVTVRSPKGIVIFTAGCLDEQGKAFEDLFEILSTRTTIYHNAPFDLSMLHRFYKQRGKCLPIESMTIHDTLAIHSTIDEVGVAGERGSLEKSAGGHGLKALTKLYLGVEYGEAGQHAFKKGITSWEEFKGFLDYASKDVEYTYRLYGIMRGRMSSHDQRLYGYFRELFPLLTRMRLWGIYIDWEAQKKLKKMLQSKIIFYTERLREIAGDESLNPNSTAQIAELLFGKWGLPVQKITESGRPSTDAATVSALLGFDLSDEKREFLEALVSYRSVSKMLSTYVKSLERLADRRDDGRVETRWNPYGTVTRRWSSSPNMQNIPHYSDFGPEIRRMYGAPPKKLFLSIDAKQIELGVFAALAGDEIWIEAYRSGVDLHTATAISLFGDQYRFADATKKKLLRQKAKRTNFAVLYGQSAESLARDLGIDEPDAMRLLRDFHARHPWVKEYQRSLIREARRTGQVVCHQTGAIRRIGQMPPVGTKEYEDVCRHLGNCHIQGTAAIITAKVAARVARRWYATGVEIPLIVHDEINFYVPPQLVYDLIDDVRRTFIDVSDEVLEGRVLIDIDTEVGYNWADLYEVDEFFEKRINWRKLL